MKDLGEFRKKDKPVIEEPVLTKTDPAYYTKCVCQHCGTAEVVYRDGVPYSVDGVTTTEALMEHGII